MKLTVLATALLLAATATSALADEGGSSRQTADNDCKRARAAGKVCALSFDTPDEVIGSVISPDNTEVNVADAVSFTSLIRMRWDFRAEIIRAAENI